MMINPAWFKTVRYAMAGILSMLMPLALVAQEPAPQAQAGMVTLNFPESVELQVLIDYVAARHQVNFIYEQSLAGRRVTLKATTPIPADSLMALLESALKMSGFTMSETEVPGLVRIAAASEMMSSSSGPIVGRSVPDVRQAMAVTRVFQLDYARPARVEKVIAPFLSAASANVIALSEHDRMIVTDFSDNMPRLEQLINIVDQPRREVEIRFIPVRRMEAATMAEQIIELIAGEARAAGRVDDGAEELTVVPDERTNQIAIVGPTKAVDRAVALAESLDRPRGTETRLYVFSIASPEQVDRLTRKIIGEVAAERFFDSAIDRESNLLVVTTTPEIHQQIERLREMLDRPVEERQSHIRFYKLQNAKAADVLATLQNIEGDEGLGQVAVDGMSAGSDATEDPLAIRGPTEANVNTSPSGDAMSSLSPGRRSANLPDARVMADEPTNTIIVIARPAMQPLYEKLIKRLDIRRPQVLIEATVVAIDTTDGFSLGVEISKGGSVNEGEGTLLNFSSFGLSKVNADTGRLTLNPGIGFNGALISSDIADIVIRALESDSRARVMSRPSVLVNDNATGDLDSKNEEPFASVNASNTVATTSFAGFASAGTKITVTPQISEGDYLKLEYTIELSSFSEAATDETATSESLPPARQTNVLESEAMIPDGHTIVVGGLARESADETIDRLPILGRIPVLEYLFSNRTKTVRKTTLFVFIRATILRDDKFRYLKYVSQDAAGRAQLAQDAPSSEPRVIP